MHGLSLQRRKPTGRCCLARCWVKESVARSDNKDGGRSLEFNSSTRMSYCSSTAGHTKYLGENIRERVARFASIACRPPAP